MTHLPFEKIMTVLLKHIVITVIAAISHCFINLTRCPHTGPSVWMCFIVILCNIAYARGGKYANVARISTI